jgi:hypothetical protein
MGYDSAYSGPGIIGEREEYCLKDPRHPRVAIRDITLGHTVEACSLRAPKPSTTTDTPSYHNT